ncbi:MAG: selenobiotic family radical SAM modification target peptide [Desulfarculaceae bacterium]|nr:selenobiotic family radical SAM modification target peptide [Desulfarculaceae bacterium]MCF8073781.1 selenobiotic family radical SAM modification target peptide [Desulfarculaceae bacterium]MCF8102022.1 selenobiotic family radical SAM modification target peptide [Desulfarculaceae bacterium]MCF8115992.1 selenobiotic family radical SAM modification target peptide [Desulfarculaceae bacterium]
MEESKLKKLLAGLCLTGLVAGSGLSAGPTLAGSG